jgi:imidazolonepropionase-like amidohydrolase
VVAEKDPDGQSAARAAWEGNLRVLKEAGVKVLVGSDQFTPIAEANALEKSGVFTRSEILAMWTGDTPRWMFPARRIGDLAAGSEASVIALGADPLEDWTAIQSVKLAVKQGKVLAAP